MSSSSAPRRFAPRPVGTPPGVARLGLVSAGLLPVGLLRVGLAIAALAGCSTPGPATPADDPVATVATEGGDKAKEQLDAARVKADLGAIRSSIKLYAQTNEGENPADLDALALTGLNFPGRYAYDAASGTVTDPEHPAW